MLYICNMEIHEVTVGNFIELDGLIGVVVGIELDEDTPEASHVAVWFGADAQQRISEGGSGNLVPEVWTVPIEYCNRANPPIFRH